MAEKDDADLNENSEDDLDEDLAETDLEAVADLTVGDGQSAQDDGDPAADSADDDAELIGEEYDLDVDNLSFGDNFEDDDEEGDGGNKKLIMLVAASVVGLAVLGGGGWVLLSGGDDSTASTKNPADLRKAGMALPPKGSSRSNAKGMLSPPLGKAAAGGGLKAVPTTVAATGVVVPSVTLAAFAKLPELPPSQPVRAQVDPELIEQAKSGPIPKIGPKGRKPWKVYARTFDGKDVRPRIAIIVMGMGLSRAATEAAISRLPGAVTLAFTPYAQALDDWASIARRSGHEVLLSLPMESATFPIEDPGPLALMSEVPMKENLRRLSFVLGKMGGYVGVISYMGSLLSKDVEKLKPILETLKSRG